MGVEGVLVSPESLRVAAPSHRHGGMGAVTARKDRPLLSEAASRFERR
jgi:hypothetical protein